MFDLATSFQKLAARSTALLRPETMAEDTPAPTESYFALRETGFLPGTMIATQNGWQAVDKITKGDVIVTFDNGPQVVVDVQTLRIARKSIPDRKAFTIHVPKGALGNNHELSVMPMQEVMIESDKAEALHGDPFVLLPAQMLEGIRGVTRRAIDADLTVTMIVFAEEQVVHCNGAFLMLGSTEGCFSPMSASADAGGVTYPRLTAAELRAIVKAERKQAAPEGTAFAGQSVEDAYAAIDARLA